jgi:hypothetical protein
MSQLLVHQSRRSPRHRFTEQDDPNPGIEQVVTGDRAVMVGDGARTGRNKDEYHLKSTKIPRLWKTL